MRYVLSNHVKNRFLKPLTIKDTVPLSIQELQRTLPSSESIMNLKRLSKVAEFVNRIPVQRSSHDIITQSTATSVEAKEVTYEDQRTITSDDVLKKYSNYGVGNWSYKAKRWFCILCNVYLPHINTAYIKGHYRVVHSKQITLAALRNFDE